MKKKRLDKIYAVPLILVLAVIPLMTMMGVYASGIGDYSWASGRAFYDFFLIYKSCTLMLAGAVLILFFLMRISGGDMGRLKDNSTRRVLVPVGVFFLVTLVSALAADERADAFFGGYEQMEGFFVILAYLLCFSFSYLYITEEAWVNVFLRALLVGSFILSLLGALQAFGIDYLTSDVSFPFFTMFMNHLPESFTGISASFGEGISYATLYNPNYVGSYVALVLPVTVLIGLWDKLLVSRILAVLSGVLQIIMLVGAQSMTGVIGVIGSALAALVFLLADGRKNRWVLCGIGGICVVAVAGILLFVPDWISRFTNSTISPCSYRISDMVTAPDSLRIELESGRELTLKLKPGGTIYEFDVRDEQGSPLTLTGDTFSGVEIAGEDYEGIRLLAAKKEITNGDTSEYYDVLKVISDEIYEWDFVKMDGRLQYVNRVGRLDQIRKVETLGFDHRYDLATNRGYIWSRTLPLLKKTLLFGVGPDNFVYAFPNDDYVGKVNCGFDGQIVTKPHNMYLQIWVQDGLPACLALLALYLIFAVRTFRRCFVKGKLTWLQKTNIALFCGTSGYMAAGLANDSCICVAPVFWVLLGIGLAVNELAVEKNRVN